ncbi:MAG TPA: hypothetical protein DCP89_03920 [Acidimicrobiaceae bacterium]|jgi:hypothetical protein|nr:hypothetical protein [Actinomycetota bacterium]NCG41170.1 hypothetical protein [Actinomycetota bacterium]HAN07626.1 hypothetical protein [Acidimicrobiaceae bacterium]
MAKPNVDDFEKIRSHNFYVAKSRSVRHRENDELRRLTKFAAALDVERDADEIVAPPPAHRPPQHKAHWKRTRVGRNRSRLAHWKSKSWKRRTAVVAARARALKNCQEAA